MKCLLLYGSEVPGEGRYAIPLSDGKLYFIRIEEVEAKYLEDAIKLVKERPDEYFINSEAHPK